MTSHQVYRTICVPMADKVEIPIPSEYLGREIEVILFPCIRNEYSLYNDETLEAMQEARDSISGKIKTKRYTTLEEFYADLDAEEEVETRRKYFLR